MLLAMEIDSYGEAFAVGFGLGIVRFLAKASPFCAVLFGVLAIIDIVILIAKSKDGTDNSALVKSLISCILLFIFFAIFAWT